MKKRQAILAAMLCGMTLQLGCFLSDIGGWDLSACWGSGLDTCVSLFNDNEEKILGGKTLIETVLGGGPTISNEQ